MLQKLSLAFVLLITSFFSYPPVTAESPKNITYLALGDSLTAGIGSSEEKYLRIHGFVPQFTKYLRTKHTVQVENYGIPGLSSTGLLALLQTDEGLRNRLKTADIISVSIGGNDFLQTIRSVPEGENEALQLRMQILQRTFDEIYTTLQKLNPDSTIMIVGLYNPYPVGHEFHSLGKEYAPLFNRMVEGYESGKTLVINPYNAFVDLEKQLTHIGKDDIHPNDEGYKEILLLMKEIFEKQSEY